MRTIMLISTGGTMEKTYDERSGQLENRRSVLGKMIRRLRLENVRVSTVELMHKDSLHMTEDDRALIIESVRAVGAEHVQDRAGSIDGQEVSGIVITHGTDTLEKTGEAILRAIPNPRVPIVLTGAMRPYEMTRSDAQQNLTEALFASGVLEPGVWCVAHGNALRFPGVRKDPEIGTFIRIEPQSDAGG